MEAPLEFNAGLREASAKGKLDDNPKFKAAVEDDNPKFKAAVDAAPKMISTGMAGVDPMTGVPQANQLAPSPINPNALGSMQPQIPSITGQPVAGAYDRVMPQTAQAGLAAPLNIGKPVAEKPNYTDRILRRNFKNQEKQKTKYAKPSRNLYKDVDGVFRDKDGKDAGYPEIRQSSSSPKGYVK